MFQKYASKTSSHLFNYFWRGYRLHFLLVLFPIMSVYSYEVLQKRRSTFIDSSQCQLGGKPSTPRLASGNLATSLLTLELKRHSVHFADKFSSALQAWLWRTCLQSASPAVSTQEHWVSSSSTPLLTSLDRCTQT